MLAWPWRSSQVGEVGRNGGELGSWSPFKNLGSNPTFDTYQFMIFFNLSGS